MNIFCLFNKDVPQRPAENPSPTIKDLPATGTQSQPTPTPKPTSR